MQCFLLPLTLIDSITSLIRKFWWSDGSKVRIWEDPWLPLPHSFLPSRFYPTSSSAEYVSDLIISGQSRWNENLLVELFPTYEIESILQIPLSTNPLPDRIIWHFTKSGMYTVKSGYKAAMEQKYRNLDLGGPSSATREKKYWTNLWRIKLLSKAGRGLIVIEEFFLPSFYSRYTYYRNSW
jgi:hypothetical protein